MIQATASEDQDLDQSAPSEAHVASPVLGRVLLAIGVLLATVGGWSVSSRLFADDSTPSGLGPMESIDQSAFAGDTGIWIEHVSLIGGGGLIEIRFRVLDVDKSEIVHDTVNPPRIVGPDGFEIRYQRHEHSHSDDNRLGGTYQEQLVNLGSKIRRGDRVTVRVGTFELKGVTVQ